MGASQYTQLELFGRKKILHCANCGQVLKHKYKPPDDSEIEGFLCADCHIDKTKEQVLKKQEEKKRLQEAKGRCSICAKELEEADKNKPKWQWEMGTGSVLCEECYDNKRTEFEKKINFCAICQKKLSFFRYNPKPKWKLVGQLCKTCWDNRNKK